MEEEKTKGTGLDLDYGYDRKPDEDVEREEDANLRKWRRQWEDEHPFNQHDFL